jgi:hypothetical protein
VSTFVPDPLKHVRDPRFQLETTARVAHGNSGGGAIDNAGHLLGVPSLTIPGQGTDVSWRLRSVAEARPLITAARNHVAYHSKILVPLTGAESVNGTGVGATSDAACSGSQTAASSGSVVFAFGVAGFRPGLDYIAQFTLPNGDQMTSNQEIMPKSGGSCLYFYMSASAVQQATMPVGAYKLQLFAGPSLTQVGKTAVVHITAPAGH